MSTIFKKWIVEYKHLLIVIVLSCLPFIFIFSTGQFFYTQDGWTHLARAGAFYKALADGQIPVRWAGDLNYSYGMPLFEFVFQFPYMLMSVFIFIGLGLVSSLKIATLLSFIFSGIFMYVFAKEFFKDEKKAIVVTLFYQFFPFRFAEMFTRGSIGEMYTFTFLPMILYGTFLYFRNSKIKSLILVSVGVAGMFLSHLATGSVFLFIALVFAIIFSPSLKKTGAVIASFVLGLGLSAYYVLPAILEHKYTYGSLFAKDLYASNFPPFLNFFLPNFLNNPTLRTGDVPIQIGIFHFLAILVSLFALFTFKKVKDHDRKLISLCLLIIIVAFFIMQPMSKFVWQYVPLFEQFQFPWRFLAPVGFATSILSVYFFNLSLIKNKIAYFLLIFLLIITTSYFWYPQLGFRKVNEADYWNYPMNTTYFGETDLIWSAGPANKYPKKRIELIGGKAAVSNVKEKSNLHIYNVNASVRSQIVDHTQFYPGWKVMIDNVDTQIQFQDPNHRGEITYYVPPGNHTVQVKFTETNLRIITDFISIVSLLLVGIILVKYKNE